MVSAIFHVISESKILSMYLSLRFEGLLANSSVLINFPQLPDVVVFLFPEFVDGAHKKFHLP